MFGHQTWNGTNGVRTTCKQRIDLLDLRGDIRGTEKEI